jgi:hypothetical protein
VAGGEVDAECAAADPKRAARPERAELRRVGAGVQSRSVAGELALRVGNGLLGGVELLGDAVMVVAGGL